MGKMTFLVWARKAEHPRKLSADLQWLLVSGSMLMLTMAGANCQRIACARRFPCAKLLVIRTKNIIEISAFLPAWPPLLRQLSFFHGYEFHVRFFSTWAKGAD